MDNIEELHCYSIKAQLENPEAPIVFDYAEGLVCAISNNSLIIYDETADGSETCVLHRIDTRSSLKYIQYLTVYNIVFLATEYELILYDIDGRKILAKRNTDKPIIELSWNPLETLFVVIDTNNDITSYSYTKNFIDQKDKVNLNVLAPIPVLVGWGSQLTQFQGPKQKRLSLSASGTTLEEISRDPPKVSWRGNSELFVVNYYQDDQRFVKVFNSELQPLNMSEPYTNLQQPVAFMGQGQCVACCAVKNGKNQLVIFEKNCKVKAEFDLTEITGSIKKLLYHPLMNMLAISFIDQDDNSFINIYLFSNGQWFLKQQLYYPPKRILHDFTWLNLQENLFTTCKMVVFTSQDVEYHYFRFSITRCPGTGTVAVVNGRNLEFYLFDKKISPPPMYYTSFKHDRTINRVIFHPTKNFCICLDSFHHIKILNIEEGQIEDLGSITNYSFEEIVKFHSVDWNKSFVGILLLNEIGMEDVKKDFNNISVYVRTEPYINETFIKLAFTDTPLPISHKLIDNNSKFIYVTRHEVEENGIVVEYEFALSAYREFFVNDVSVCNGVTSFYVFEGYLIFTHSSAKLYCIRMKDHALYTNVIHLSTIFSRDIEQGATIVACTNLLFPQIILQMPRGNIETIGCKLITVDVVENMLKENKWVEVLHILRTEKVNWNVLIDLNSERFREHIEDFVKASRNNTMLSNIVTEFNTKENCFQTFYKNYFPKEFSNRVYDKKAIIEDILKYLVTTDCINNLPSIIAIQQKHISLKAALNSIKDVYEANKQENEGVCSKNIKQLLVQEHFKDVENAAYNLYDLDFLTLIYYNSLEDPKIYEPEIKNFRMMGPIERRFKMSIRGHNVRSSVKYLLRSDTVDESFITNFILKNRLEDVAYFCIEDYHKHFILVSELYANRLSILKRYVEAGVIYKRAGKYKEALQEFKIGLDWREITGLCTLMELNEEEAKKIYVDVAARLVKANLLDDAVVVLQTYGKDYRAAIDILVEHNSFRKAICLAETYREDDLIEKVILPKLSEYTSVLNEKIDNYRVQFETYANRLIVVRDERITKLQAIVTGNYDDDDDLYPQSETGTYRSGSKASHRTSKSRMSTLSSRNRRKEERKKIDLKHGGFYEDIALMRVLHILYNEVFDFGNEIKEICLICHHNKLEVTRKLHDHLSNLHNDMIKRIPEIWSDVFLKEEDDNQNVVAAIIQNKQDLEPQFRVPPSQQNADSWKLEMFS